MNTPLPEQTHSIRGWIQRHPITAFLELAFVISWAAYLLSLIDLGVVNGFGVLFSLGPALAAVIVSAICSPQSTPGFSGRRLPLFIILALVTLAILAVRRLWVTPLWLATLGMTAPTTAYPSLLAFLVDALGSAGVGFLISGVLSPREGVRDLLRSLDPRAVPVRWVGWVLAFGLYPLCILAGNALSGLLGQPVPAAGSSAPWTMLALDALLIFLFQLICAGGLEEPGWRGFLLPELQKRFRPLAATLILSLFWGLWHLPFFWSQGWPGGPLGVVVYLVMEIIPMAVLFTAFYNRTNGSLPIAMMLHAVVNTAPLFLPMSAISTYLWLMLMVGLAVWMGVAPKTFAGKNVSTTEATSPQTGA
jgi:membrane protease YdiL (CAAX protease family)